MSVFAIELADRALSFARDGHVLSRAPSSVFDANRPRRISSQHLSSVLMQRNASARIEALVEAELNTRLAGHPVENTDRVWIVAPAGSQPAGLAAMLGIARRLSLPVDGFIDSATITTAATIASAETAPVRNAVVLEIGLHHAAATAVDGDGGQARRRRSVYSERGGLTELYQSWLDLVSATMVKRTRFDPLHDVSTEQQLFDALPALSAEAASPAGKTTAAVNRRGQRFEVDLTRDQFAQAGEPIYRSILSVLHQLRPAGAQVCLLLPKVVATLPGLRERLDQFSDCELALVPDGFAAEAASLRDLPGRTGSDDAVPLLRRIPLSPHQVPADAVIRDPLGRQRTGPAPSPVLWDGRAHSLSVESLVVGRTLSDTPRHLVLPEGLAGVSRRHCTFVHDGEGLVLLDHSAFGTFVNGERVAERVRLYAGDRVRVGDPGVEFALIAVGDIAGGGEPAR